MSKLLYAFVFFVLITIFSLERNGYFDTTQGFVLYGSMYDLKHICVPKAGPLGLSLMTIINMSLFLKEDVIPADKNNTSFYISNNHTDIQLIGFTKFLSEITGIFDISIYCTFTPVNLPTGNKLLFKVFDSSDSIHYERSSELSFCSGEALTVNSMITMC